LNKVLPETETSRTGRRILKRALYFFYTLQHAFLVLFGKAQPNIAFTVEANPSSVYFNFRIKPECREAFARYINLADDRADNLALSPIQCLVDEEPDFLLTLNIYEVSGIVSGLRAEWSTYISDAEGVPRYMVVEARCERGSLDPVELFTQPGRVEHTMTADAIESLVVSNDEALFRATCRLDEEQPFARIATEWVVANDNIYWRNGIYDRTYYDANMIDAPVRHIPVQSVSIDDQTHWAQFIEPEPRHVLKYEGPLHFMIIPWYNV
jgi:hypothetical protein